MQIIDNRTRKLVDEVNNLLPSTMFSKMAVGYFYLSGFEHIRPNLVSVQNLKLLIGNSTNQATADELIAGYGRLDVAERSAEQLELLNRDQIRDIVEATAASVREQLENMPQNDPTEEGVKTLQQLIAEKRVEVRVYTRGILHSKAYIFEYPSGSPLYNIYKGTAIVGSSNLSHGGLSSNSELNVQLKEQEDFDKVNEWFDGLWAEAEPFDVSLLSIVKGSWVGRTLTPYDLYLKTLYEMVKDRLEDDQPISALDELNLPPLMDFQWDAFNQARRILDQHGGVFVADVVGFGKSYIGSALIKYYRDYKKKRTLIICPAKLVPMWKTYVAAFDLGAEVYSMGMLTYPEGRQGGPNQYSLNDVEALEMYDMVLIDESHNFRNPDTDRYQILQPYLRGRQVILLTATPQNKSVWDYYHQIKLFHQQERTTFPLSTARLDTFFKQCEERPAQLSQLLQHILIRRRRRDIVETYQPILNGKPVTFPRRKLQTLSYEIERTYHQGVYSEVTRLLANDLQFTRYGLAAYLRTDLSKSARKSYEGLSRAGTQLRGLIKMLLLKRMESSAQALVNTINNMLRSYRAFRTALDSHVVLVGHRMEQILRTVSPDSDLDNEALLDLWETLGDDYRYSLKDFDARRLISDTDADIEALESLKLLVEPIVKTNVDDKRDELIRQLDRLGNQKALIFTEFQDTASYLDSELKKKFPDREIARATGSNNTVELVRRFAPKANTRNGLRAGDREIDILIATDALSEGQNLQDASIVINYDIHWNPVRLIQRIGRVDRIGSEASVIEVYNFLPERELEKQLNLQGRVQRRIQEIHDVLGEDDKILTEQEVLNESSLYQIAHGDVSVLDVDGPQDSITPLQEAERVIRDLERNDPERFAQIKALPGGARGSLCLPQDGREATFAFCRAGDYRKLYLQTAQEVTTDEMAILNALRCGPDAPVTPLPHSHNTNVMKLFADFEREIEIIASDLSHQRMLARSQKYVDEALRAYFTGVTDLKERRIIEQLRSTFTGDLEQYVIAALNRLQRDKLTGAVLVDALSAIYSAFDMGAERSDTARQRARERSRQARLVCSGSSPHEELQDGED